MDTRHLSSRAFQSIRHRSANGASLLHTLCHLADGRDERIFLVGGLLRDVLLGDAVGEADDLDIDLAVEGSVEAFLPALTEAAEERPIVHERFGTASAVLADGTRVDLAQTRSERYPSPGALPIVSGAPIEVDLGRRDFSINAMALALTSDRQGALLDPYGGVRDIGRRRIRTLHPLSFRDDPTRLVRAARYAARIGGTIEGRTVAEAKQHGHHLEALTAERFGDAWRLLLEEGDPAAGLRIARRLGILQMRDPRWTVPAGVVGITETPTHFWAGLGLLHADAGVCEWLPRSVGMRRLERSALADGVSLRGLRRSLGHTRRMSTAARALRRYGDPALEDAARIWHGRSGSVVGEYLRRRAEVRSPVSAAELVEAGVEPGPAVGRALDEIAGLVWDGELEPDDDAAVARLKQRIRLSR